MSTSSSSLSTEPVAVACSQLLAALTVESRALRDLHGAVLHENGIPTGAKSSFASAYSEARDGASRLQDAMDKFDAAGLTLPADDGVIRETRDINQLQQDLTDLEAVLTQPLDAKDAFNSLPDWSNRMTDQTGTAVKKVCR